MNNLSKRALILKKIFQQLDPGSIQTLIADWPDAIKVFLRDGSLFLAQLNDDNSLRLDPIDTTC